MLREDIGPPGCRGLRESVRGRLAGDRYAFPMRVTVLLFGAEREAAGSGRALVELADGRSCGVLRRTLAMALPALVPHLAGGRFAVNGEFVDDGHELGEGDEVALIGLVGGG